jgi:hypothetical protein
MSKTTFSRLPILLYIPKIDVVCETMSIITISIINLV